MSRFPLNQAKALLTPVTSRPVLKMGIVPGVAAAASAAAASAASATDASGQAEAAALSAAQAAASAFIAGGYSVLGMVIDGGDAQIAAGIKSDLYVPFNCRVIDWTLLADRSGSIQLDVWNDGFGNFPPADADSITASAPPLISSAQSAHSATLTGWLIDITAGSTIRFNVDSCNTIRRVTAQLTVLKT